ncbi:MAG: hypothetical protein UY62_C0012G0005 [Parcubacteria group bacterium GW2011_GWF2_50_9]|nr:MAG: hypothetical protein UY62_C0012G0005 [Parcubacteria group bacterium GW2011_GWF2_50_9]
MELEQIKEKTVTSEMYLSHIEKGLFHNLKEPAALAAIRELQANPRFWALLIKKLKVIDIFILEILYVPRSTATFMQDVVNRIGKYNLQRTAIRNRLDRLELLGLIKLQRSSLTCVNSIPALEQNIKKLIICCKMRFGW